ncbi:MAG: TetR/AcrR family transcriptional regulator [Burkholderiales bacterium]|nr:MAG: TetR/AcrR family transcriptional regulator [Burkholderiales bacterium]
MPSDARERMVQAAMLLVGRKGVAGTSLTDALRSADAPRGSLYHYFPGGKDELMLAAIAAAGERLLREVETVRGTHAVDNSELEAGCTVAAVTLVNEESCRTRCAAGRPAVVFRSPDTRGGSRGVAAKLARPHGPGRVLTGKHRSAASTANPA